jgi:hypothetical protein
MRSCFLWGRRIFKKADKANFVKEKPSSSMLASTVSKSVVVVDQVSVEGVAGSSIAYAHSTSKPNTKVRSPKVHIKAHRKLKPPFHVKPTFKWGRVTRVGEKPSSGIDSGSGVG